MAIQNFVAGGFYGKLGDIVGQRWRNKRTMRIHVIPDDPKTPEQLANRSQFGTAVSLAQVALNLGKGDPIWADPDIPEFPKRVGVAKTRLQQELTEGEAYPIMPDNTQFSRIFANLHLQHSMGKTNFRLLTDGVPPGDLNESSLTYNLYYRCFNLSTNQWEYKYTQETGLSPSLDRLPFSMPFYISFPVGSFVLGIDIYPHESASGPSFIPWQNITEELPVERHVEGVSSGAEVDGQYRIAYYEADYPLWFTPETILGAADVYTGGAIHTVDDIVEWDYLGGLLWRARAPQNPTYQWPSGTLFYGIEREVNYTNFKLLTIMPGREW